MSVKLQQKLGSEPFLLNGRSIDVRLAEFWRWGFSDLAIDAVREKLAEFLVLKALKIPTKSVRAGSRFVTPRGSEMQVYSRTLIPGLGATPKSVIFGNPKELLSGGRGKFAAKEKYPEVFIFAVFLPPDAISMDPVNLDQWIFFALNSSILSGWERTWINIHVLNEMGGSVSFRDLPRAVADAEAITKYMRFRCNADPCPLEIRKTSLDSNGAEEWEIVHEWHGNPKRPQIWKMQTKLLSDPRHFKLCMKCGQRTLAREIVERGVCESCSQT
jgi:hypothetical protein